MKVLFADDDAKLRTALQIILEDAGYQTVSTHGGHEAIIAFDRENPDLVILDIMMPDMSGIQVCQEIRKRSPFVPVLLLTAKGDISDKREGFHSGADDYLTKPFNQEELLLHVEALLRKTRLTQKQAADNAKDAGSPSKSHLLVGDLEIDLEHRTVRMQDDEIMLTPLEFKILALLSSDPGRVFSRDEIAQGVWGNQYQGKDVAIATHVRHLREKIEPDPANPSYVKTVGRLGYKLDLSSAKI